MMPLRRRRGLLSDGRESRVGDTPARRLNQDPMSDISLPPSVQSRDLLLTGAAS